MLVGVILGGDIEYWHLVKWSLTWWISVCLLWHEVYQADCPEWHSFGLIA